MPKKKERYTPETAEQLRQQWINEYHLEEKYLPNEPRVNNEQSINLYQEHLAAIQRIINIQKEIAPLKEKLDKYDQYETLIGENEILEKKINELRSKTIL